MPESRRIARIAALTMVAALAAAAADAQTCEPCVFDQPLVEPFEISSQNGVLDTSLRVELKSHKVPVWEFNGSWQCCLRAMSLRTYGYPAGPGFKFAFPGPTLRLRKPSTPTTLGDRLRLLLVNALPLASDDLCDPGCNCAQDPPPQCCLDADEHPNCFHGLNTTNLHFHGSHVSPQPPQDFVLLELRPGGSPTGPPTHGRGVVAVGSYQFDVHPLRYTQSDGTHWYHAHKHGSVALQLGDGMAGALLIQGPFDDFLKSFYSPQGGLDEKILIVQQVHGLNFAAPIGQTSLPPPLVNGQTGPKITMFPGEVQRWRLVSATMQGGAQITIDFNGPNQGPLAAKQIAMDGIQFAPKNYDRQPFLPGDLQEFRLSPGNRADFLVRAPLQPGIYRVTYDVFGHVEETRRREALQSLLEFLGPGGEEPTLLTVEVVPCTNCQPMSFPTPLQWPPLPPYLADIGPLPTRERQLFFALENPDGTPGSPGVQPTHFFIGLAQGENRQFDPDCVDVTVALGSAEQWRIHNNLSLGGTPFHVFHIHTNPFQLIQSGTTTYEAPYPWMDSITLADMSLGPTVIRHRFEQLTGEYVLHCHFLGHEDRGMMLGVQAVCPNQPDSFGKARADGGPECVAGNYIPAAPRCPSPVP